MSEKAPLVDQETKAPTRKLKAGVAGGTAFAITLVPLIFPELMKIIEIVAPAFAETWGPIIAAVTSAVLAVFGGGSVAYVVRNRASAAQVATTNEIVERAVLKVIGKDAE